MKRFHPNNIFFTVLSMAILGQGCSNETVKPSIRQSVKTIKLHDWDPLTSNIVDDLHDVFFISSDKGWIVGDNGILLATSSGANGWGLAPVGNHIQNLRSVFFIDDQNGWIAGDFEGTTPMGQIDYTGQGGAYPQLQDNFGNPLNVVFFITPEEGWAAGVGGMWIRTENGGKTWETGESFTAEDITDISFQGPEDGWIVTRNGGLYHTSDGLSWLRSEIGLTSDLTALHFTDRDHAWACGSANTLLRGIKDPEGSMNWNILKIDLEPAGTGWNDIFFLNREEGWVIGNGGKVYITKDGGDTWESQSSNAFSDLNAIFMFNNNNGWIVGDDGVILSYNPV